MPPSTILPLSILLYFVEIEEFDSRILKEFPLAGAVTEVSFDCLLHDGKF